MPICRTLHLSYKQLLYMMFYEWSKFVEGYFNNDYLVIIEKMPEKRKHLIDVQPNRINKLVRHLGIRVSKILLPDYDDKELHILMSKLSLKYSNDLVKNDLLNDMNCEIGLPSYIY